jgi:hypothetical protein
MAVLGATEGPPGARPAPRPALTLHRTRSDYGPRSGIERSVSGEEDDFAMRHGWQEEYTSSEYLKMLHSVGVILSFVVTLEAYSFFLEFLYVLHRKAP